MTSSKAQSELTKAKRNRLQSGSDYQAGSYTGGVFGLLKIRAAGPKSFVINLMGAFMSDDKTKRGTADRDRINIHEEYELRDWSKRFGVSPDELKKAVQQVGTSADAVRKHLGK